MKSVPGREPPDIITETRSFAVTDPKTRRFFLGAVTAAAATRVWGANDKINVGIVGIGGRGTNHLNTYSRMPDARVVGLCDVNQAAREVAKATLLKNTGEKAKEFEDMRAMFADSVGRGGLHRHSQPLARAVHHLGDEGRQGRLLRKAGLLQHLRRPADDAGCARDQEAGADRLAAPQHAVQDEGHSQALQQGLIGKIYMAKGLCYKRRPSIGHTADAPTPPGVNWDLFLGPAPMRPFNEKRFKYNWHWFWDTGNGDIGNQGVHEMGIARWGLGDPEWPKTAVSFGGKFGIDDDQETPNTLMAGFNYGDRELVFEVRGMLTGGEGVRQGRVVTAGPGAGAPDADRPARLRRRRLRLPRPRPRWDRPAIRSTWRSAICSTAPRAGPR